MRKFNSLDTIISPNITEKSTSLSEFNKVVVQRLLKLIRFRNEYSAFNGKFKVIDSPDDKIRLSWQVNGENQFGSSCSLTVDLNTYCTVINYLDNESGQEVTYEP